METCLAEHPQGCVLTVKVSPNARQTALGPVVNGTLTIRLHAKPVEGAANTELIRYLSQILAIPKSRLQLLSGQTSRTKRLLVTGLTTTQAFATLIAIPK
jgi:hypothetical protein